MKKQSKATGKPNLDPTRFWDFRYEDIDWHKSSTTIIERILERGSKTEWQELVRFYSEKKVKDTIRNKISYLPNDIIDEVCAFFALKKQELKCYIRKQSLPKHWI